MNQQPVEITMGAEITAHIDALGQRLADTAIYLRGIAAVVESMNKGAADSIEIAIHAVEAVSEDLIATCDEGLLSDTGGRALPGNFSACAA